jgi:hypothetical protein
VAIFNLGDRPAELHFRWMEFGLAEFSKPGDKIDLKLPAHGSAVFSDLSPLAIK